MKPDFKQLFNNYDESDFLLQQKVKIIFTISMSILVILPLVIAYTVFIEKMTAPGVILPEIMACFIVAGAMYLLVKGRFLLASHMILITCLVAAWLVIFLDPSGLVTKLDTIAFVLAALTITPLIVNEKKWPIPAYFLMNIVILSIFEKPESEAVFRSSVGLPGSRVSTATISEKDDGPTSRLPARSAALKSRI